MPIEALFLLTVLASVNPNGAVAERACGTIETVVGGGTGDLGDGGPASQARLHQPYGVAIGPDGDIYVADTYNHRIRRVDRDTGIIETIAGAGPFGFSGDGGPAVAARIDRPYAIDFGPDGALYFTDTGNARIRRVDLVAGVISTAAGGGSGALGDGGPATAATLGTAYGLRFGPDGNLYIADTGHNRVRRVDRVTGIITTVAGNGGPIYPLGDGKPATEASLSIPYSITFYPEGDLIISDMGHGRVRRVDRTTGIISTIAGMIPVEGQDLVQPVSSLPAPIPGWGMVLGDGGHARNAILAKIRTIVSDGDGNLFLADSTSSRIWRIDRETEVITSIVGTGSDGYSGDGGASYKAAVWDPLGIALDRDGNLYVADTGNYRIRRAVPPFCWDPFPPVIEPPEPS